MEDSEYPIVSQLSDISGLPPDKARFANAFIESIHKLDLPEKKLLAHITQKMQKGGQKVIEITPGEMLEWSGLGGTNYTFAKEKLLHLQEKGVIVFEEVIENEKGQRRKTYEAYSFLEHVKYVERGSATLTLTDFMSKFILDVKERYTEVYLSCVCKFSSKYSLRFYELCKRYQFKGGWTFEVGEMATLLNAPKDYSKPSYLIAYALKPAIKDINAHSDILVDISTANRTRKAGKTSMKATVRENPAFKPMVKSHIQPKLPNIDTGEAEENRLELELRMAGLKGDVKKIIRQAGGYEAVAWYWKKMLSKDNYSAVRNRNAYIKKFLIENAGKSFALHKDDEKRNITAINVEAVQIKSNPQAEAELKSFLSAKDWRKRLERLSANAPDDFFRDYVIENFVRGKDVPDADRFSRWVKPLIEADANLKES